MGIFLLRTVVLEPQQARYSSRNINDGRRLFVSPHLVKKSPSLVNVASH